MRHRRQARTRYDVSAATPAVPPTQNRKRFPFGWYALALALIILFTVAPLLSILLSSAIAEANGCVLNEGGANPCVIGGTDWGHTLATMFVLGWLMFLTLPVGALAFVIWLIVLVVHLVTRSRRRRARAA